MVEKPAVDSPKTNGETKPMEVVTDVPKDAKPAGDAVSDETKVAEKTGDLADGKEPDDEKKARPFNRIKRFFSASGK